MSYSPNIPQATDDPSQSQPQILANFQQINTQYGTGAGLLGDHVALTASSNNGKHNKVSWIDQTAALPIVPGSNQVVAFAITNSGITMPYYVRDTISSATTLFPLAPIKAYASFQSLAASGNITPFDSFNVTGPIVQTNGTPTTFTINLTNACRTTTYGVTFSINLTGVLLSSGQYPGYTTPANNQVILSIPFNNPALTPLRNITITIMET